MKKIVLFGLLCVLVLGLAACDDQFSKELNQKITNSGKDVEAGRSALLSILDTELKKERYPPGIVGVKFGTQYMLTGAKLENGGLQMPSKGVLYIAIPKPVDQMGWSKEERDKINKLMDRCLKYEDPLNYSGWLYVDENFKEFPTE